MTVAELTPFQFFGVVFLALIWFGCVITMYRSYKTEGQDWPIQAKVFFWLIMANAVGLPGYAGFTVL